MIDRSAFELSLVLAGEDDLARYEQPPRGQPGRAGAVARPRSVDEVRQLVRDARRAGVRLIPQGANSGLVGAAVPPIEPEAIVVSSERLSHICVDPVDAVAVVGAGVRLSALNAAAAPHGLHLPIDLGSDPAIGGMVSTNTGGSRVLRYGSMRHQVLGLRAVIADAEASVVGSVTPLRKDSRGLDLAHLFVGAGGTLGVIVEVAVALTPVPQRTETWWLAIDTPSAATAIYHRLDRLRPGLLSAFEFVSANALQRTLDGEGAPTNPFGRGMVPAVALLVEWAAARPEYLDGLENDVAELVEVGWVSDAVVVPPDHAWGLRHQISERLRRHGTVLGYDVGAPRAELVAMRAELLRRWSLGPFADVPICDFGHVGDGGLHINPVIPAGVDPAGVREWMDRVVTEVFAEPGWSWSAEHGLGPRNAPMWRALADPGTRAAVAALKAAFDPSGILGHPAHPYNSPEA